MLWTIVAATVAFLLGVWIASRYGRHVFFAEQGDRRTCSRKSTDII